MIGIGERMLQCARHAGAAEAARFHQTGVIRDCRKEAARLNCIHHLLQQVPYKEIPHPFLTLPERVFSSDYERKVLPDKLCVPETY
jgi:hypothetical protein